MTEKDYLDDRYFTQTLLPDYLVTHPECRSWDIVWDARGHFSEPHTGRTFGLGTLEVRDYLGLRVTRSDAVTVNRNVLYPTSGPESRFNTILFVEKEGFDPLFAAEHLAERYDLAIMSTKGMLVTASRLLLDRLTERVSSASSCCTTSTSAGSRFSAHSAPATGATGTGTKFR